MQVLYQSIQLEKQLSNARRESEVLGWVLDSQAASADPAVYMHFAKELAKVCYTCKPYPLPVCT